VNSFDPGKVDYSFRMRKKPSRQFRADRFVSIGRDDKFPQEEWFHRNSPNPTRSFVFQRNDSSAYRNLAVVPML